MDRLMTTIIGLIDNYKHYRRKGFGRGTAIRLAVYFLRRA